MVDPDRLSAAYETARCDLLAESAAEGHWIGELSSSPFATATAISALALVERQAPTIAGRFADENRECRLSELIMKGVRWLANQQNADGGWGDTDKSPSNIATTMVVRAAFALTAVPAVHPCLLERADGYIKAAGGLRGLRRHFGRDKALAVPILANLALAGLIPWRKLPALPFELACVPEQVWKVLRLPMITDALPALVAIGQAGYFHRKPWNPITRLLRRATAEKSLQVLASLQPDSGGFLEAAPLTSFVVMSLTSIGRVDHPVVRKGLEFLLASVRPDGSWPIDANLAIWNTTQAVNTLAAAGEDIGELTCRDWVLACQQRAARPSTAARPGGWAWTDRPGGIPDADSTAGALLALAAWSKADASSPQTISAASAGVKWLLDGQNADGGWPTCCRGSGRLPWDRSGSDLTAHALRALHAWRTSLAKHSASSLAARDVADARIGAAMERGLRYVSDQQRADGSWVPLWFGNQHRADEANPIYGTTKVLAMYRDLNRLNGQAPQRALDWLLAMQHDDGSFGGSCTDGMDKLEQQQTVEETALATEALLSCGQNATHEAAAGQGLDWLIDTVEANHHQKSSPIGRCFAKLWYYEKLYPLVFTVGALGRAARQLLPRPTPPAVVHSAKN